jgi:hypothetical protein
MSASESATLNRSIRDWHIGIRAQAPVLAYSGSWVHESLVVWFSRRREAADSADCTISLPRAGERSVFDDQPRVTGWNISPELHTGSLFLQQADLRGGIVTPTSVHRLHQLLFGKCG